MRKKRIEKVGHKAVISESVYNDTHRDFKGVWETEREGCEKYRVSELGCRQLVYLAQLAY